MFDVGYQQQFKTHQNTSSQPSEADSGRSAENHISDTKESHDVVQIGSMADSLEEHQERLRMQGPLLVREHLTNLAQEIINTDRQLRISKLQQSRRSAHQHSNQETGESQRESIDETIVNLKSSGTINLELRGAKGLNLSSSAQREPHEPALNVKDPKKLKELHKMELSLMESNMQYYGQ